MTAIWADYRGIVDGINIAIMAEWLKGGGLQPVTWATLTSTMAKAGEVALAEKINESLTTATVGDGATGHPSDVIFDSFAEIRSAPPLGQ